MVLTHKTPMTFRYVLTCVVHSSVAIPTPEITVLWTQDTSIGHDLFPNAREKVFLGIESTGSLPAVNDSHKDLFRNI